MFGEFGIFDRASNAARNAVLSWLFPGNAMTDQEEKKAQDLIVLARKYYDGDHEVYLTDRQEAWLDLHNGQIKFTVNHCPTIIDAIVERLKVTGFGLPEGNDLADQLWKWWKDNRMDIVQIEAHRWALRDGESFILVNWDKAGKLPEFILHPRFVDKSAGGKGFGMWMEYPQDNYLMKPERAIKQWEETNAEGKNQERMTIYYPDRVERYVKVKGKWAEYRENEADEWPTPWVLSDGTPIGIPVTHFINSGLISEIKEIIPLQDALNKSWLDIMAAADTTAFQMLVFLGWIPTTDGQDPKSDGSNLLKVAPGQMIGTKKSPNNVDFREISPADLTPLLDVEERIVFRMALISDTPLSRFLTSKQVSSADTLKEQDRPLVAKVQERQTRFGNAWEDTMILALRIAKAFGGMTEEISDLELSTLWSPAELVDEKLQAEAKKLKQELGVTTEQLWAELGYSEEQIEKMMESPEYLATLANLELARLTAEELQSGS
jgi:hypothetical protein